MVNIDGCWLLLLRFRLPFLRAGQGANFPWAGNKFFLVRVQILACRGVLLLLIIFTTSSTESVTA